MLKLLGAIAVLAAIVAGCDSSDRAPSAAPSAATPEPIPTPEATPAAAERHKFEKGHSRAVREYYRHDAGPAHDNIEAEYHKPPKPATGGIGDTITLTGTNIGVRVRVKLTGLVDPAGASPAPRAGTRYVAAKLRLRSTGITILEDDFRNALLSHDGGRRVPASAGVKAGCSNGFHDFLRLEVGRGTRGCLLFQVPEGKRPRQLQLALEQIPAGAGGRWILR